MASAVCLLPLQTTKCSSAPHALASLRQGRGQLRACLSEPWPLSAVQRQLGAPHLKCAAASLLSHASIRLDLGPAPSEGRVEGRAPVTGKPQASPYSLARDGTRKGELEDPAQLAGHTHEPFSPQAPGGRMTLEDKPEHRGSARRLEG